MSCRLRAEEKERRKRIRSVIEEVKKKERDPDTIWTDGSKLDSGGV